MCTQLIQAGVEPVLIAQLSGHKNIASLSTYVTASLEQQEGMSNILQRADQGPSISNHAIPGPSRVQEHRPLALAAMPPASSLSQYQTGIIRSHVTANQSNRLAGAFSGANFNAPVTINIHHYGTGPSTSK